MDMKDKDLTESIQGDPFHTGLAEHGEFIGFEKTDARGEDSHHTIDGMTEEEIKKSRSLLARLVRNPQLLLVLTYLGILCLMGKAYA
jgi:hypothetical protein